MKPRWVKWLALAFAVLAAPSDLRAETDFAARLQELIAGLDYDEARGALATANLDDPQVALERARLAVYELDCDGAAAIFGRPELQSFELGEQLANIARGCQRVTAALAVDRDEERGVEVRWQDEHDRALAPLIFDTVVRARDALTRDLGVDWPRPTRIVVVRDLLSLSAMTGLPYKSAQTTGTVAVAKWGRITLLSPRASRHGYAWRDTLAHELTHLAVTRASRDRASLWLQEGVAKHEEVRWRDPGPFDERPSAEAIVQRGQEQKLAIPLDRLGPSIAMLPSADQATVAFAEVTSFVRFYVETAGADALPRLLAELKAGKQPDQALVAASGANLKEWDAKWRAYVASKPREPTPPLFSPESKHREIDAWTEVRNRTRLAELLLARGHATEALDELDPIFVRKPPAVDHALDSVTSDPNIRWLRARALEGAGRRQDGEGLVADPKEALSSYAPWWALRGRWARLRGDEVLATASFIEAIAADPFDVEAACESTGDAAAGAAAAETPLCDAARAADTPPFGED
ncbi:MAG: hypothetical protein M3O46_09565 [Myxococcota bacterium]|nr:hypothetical protein [Myxococcota bacterium]